MVELAATVFVLVVAHIYIRAYLGWELFRWIIGGVFVLFCGLIALALFPGQTTLIVGIIVVSIVGQLTGVTDQFDGWRKERRLGKRIV